MFYFVNVDVIHIDRQSSTIIDTFTSTIVSLFKCHPFPNPQIDPKRAIPREEQDKTEKIFVGGIAPEVTEDEFKDYFGQFGHVIDATLMTDRETGRPRGFGFITFESDKGVEEAMKRTDLAIRDKQVGTADV